MFNYALFTLPKCSPSHRINKYEILIVLSAVKLLHVFWQMVPHIVQSLTQNEFPGVFFFLKYSVNTETHLSGGGWPGLPESCVLARMQM